MKTILLLISMLTSFPAICQENAGKNWSTLARIKFETKLNKEHNTYVWVPVMDQRAADLEGKDFVIKGYYLPFDMPGGELVISEYPYSACFFCGGAGPESIIEVRLKSGRSNFKVDELITVRGKMKINGTDPDHAIFILEDAEVVAR